MGKMGALLIAFSAGLAFFLGALIVAFFKDKKKISDFAIAMSFAVILGVIILELIPEIKTLLAPIKPLFRYLLIIILTLGGILFVKILDILIPHHHYHNKGEEKHLSHIGLVTAVALLGHNFIEGLSIYSAYILNPNLGILLSLGVIIHNIPLGMQITANMNKEGIKAYLLLLALTCATILGPLTIFVLNINLAPFWFGIFMTFSLGMLLYIVLFELLTEFVKNIKQKRSLIGFGCGLLVVFLGMFIG